MSIFRIVEVICFLFFVVVFQEYLNNISFLVSNLLYLSIQTNEFNCSDSCIFYCFSFVLKSNLENDYKTGLKNLNIVLEEITKAYSIVMCIKLVSAKSKSPDFMKWWDLRNYVMDGVIIENPIKHVFRFKSFKERSPSSRQTPLQGVWLALS